MSTDLVDDGYWSTDLANCKISDETLGDNGGTRMAMMRSDAGVADVKVGGAAFLGARYEDGEGVMVGGSYIGWANEAAEEADGATSVTTFGALIAAAVALMF